MSEQPLDETQRPELLAPVLPEHVPTEFDRTLEGYVQLLGDMQVTQSALGNDYTWWANGHRGWLETAAKPQIDAMNAGRQGANAEPIDVKTASTHFLAGITRPNWSEYFPGSDSDEATKEWEGFKGQFSPGMQVNLEALRTLHTKVEILHTDQELQAEFSTARLEHIQDLRHAAMWRSAGRKVEAAAKQMALIRIDAGKTGRPLTPAERQQLQVLGAEQAAYREGQRNVPLTKEVTAELFRAQDVDRKRELDKGLLRTEQMNHIIDEVLPALSRGEPALLVGETGGAKTALAEFISTNYFGKEAELVSGYGDVNTYQLMGKPSISEQNGASVSTFSPGPVVRAMQEGRPLILDEINAMPPELLKRFNKIMQMRPGDRFVVQEDSGMEVAIQPGFCILATANEKSKRYKGLEDLSVEFQNRFGANIYRVRYPDHDVPFGAVPLENSLLAKAAIVDKKGNIPEDLNPDELYNFIRASHVSQQVFSGNFGEGFNDYRSGAQQVDKKPGLEETVLAPRTMVGILRDVAGSYGQMTLDQSLGRFVDGIKNQNDKQVMLTILQNHGFLQQPKKD